MAHSDEPISIIEDLDPEPPSGRGGRQVWEFVLGGLILLGVLGFAGLQWLSQDALQRNYQAGVDAAARHDWDDAHSFFLAATGYYDADQQARSVATTIALRDAQYKSALDDENVGNWMACLKAIQQVDNIEQNFQYSARIERNATAQVYREAVSGTVAIRADATPPGLYYYGASGWVWLPQSDTYSRIQGSGSSDWLVYDVPNPGWTPGKAPPSPDPATGLPELQDRHLAAVHIPALSQTTVSIPIDPTQIYNFQWGHDGLWATSYPSGDPVIYLRDGPVRGSLFGSARMTLTYQSFTGPAAATTRMESMGDKAAVMSLDPNSNRYLLATWSGEAGDGTVITSTVTNLYLAHAGGDRRLLYSVTGGSFISAQFSPDGAYALLIGYVPFDSQTAASDVFVLKLDGTSPPRSVARTIISMNDGEPEHSENRLMASFVGSGPYSGDVVIAEHDEDHNYLRLVDPRSGGDPLVVIEIPDGKPLDWSLFQGSKGEVMLVAPEEPFTMDPSHSQDTFQSQPINFVVLSPEAALKVTGLIVAWNTYKTSLEYATVVGNQLAFSTHTCCGEQDTASVYSMPISQLGAQREHPTTSYDQTGPAEDIYPPSFGTTLFAYISGGNLHARLYDGTIDIVLEHGVSYLYNTSENLPWQGLLQ